MSNRLITPNEAAAMLMADLDLMSPAEQAATVYALQTSLGGFPRDLEQERKIIDALKAESDALAPPTGEK